MTLTLDELVAFHEHEIGRQCGEWTVDDAHALIDKTALLLRPGDGPNETAEIFGRVVARALRCRNHDA